MRQYDNYIANFRSYWTGRAAGSLHQVSGETEHSDEQNCRDSVRNKCQATSESTDEGVSGYRRKPTKNKKPADVFQETLDILNEMFPERNHV